MNYSYKTKFATNHVQDNKINNVSNASKQYANFRAEALNDDGIRKVINLLEQARYCWSSVGSELEQAKQDKQQAQTNMATYKQNVENAEGDYSDSIDTVNSNDRSVDNLNTPLITDVRENGITFTVEPNYNQKSVNISSILIHTLVLIMTTVTVTPAAINIGCHTLTIRRTV